MDIDTERRSGGIGRIAATAVGVVVAVLLVVALWQILRLALGLALGIVIAVAIIVGGIWLLVRRATSSNEPERRS
jgi:uncharacterized membrane protein YqjE